MAWDTFKRIMCRGGASVLPALIQSTESVAADDSVLTVLRGRDSINLMDWNNVSSINGAALLNFLTLLEKLVEPSKFCPSPDSPASWRCQCQKFHSVDKSESR